MKQPIIDQNILISHLLTLYPQVATLLIDLRVNCIGCSLNRFCTVSDLCEYYQLDEESVWDLTMKAID